MCDRCLSKSVILILHVFFKIYLIFFPRHWQKLRDHATESCTDNPACPEYNAHTVCYSTVDARSPHFRCHYYGYNIYCRVHQSLYIYCKMSFEHTPDLQFCVLWCEYFKHMGICGRCQGGIYIKNNTMEYGRGGLKLQCFHRVSFLALHSENCWTFILFWSACAVYNRFTYFSVILWLKDFIVPMILAKIDFFIMIYSIYCTHTHHPGVSH